MKMFTNVVLICLLIQMVLSQLTTIPIGRKCGCIEMPVNNPPVPIISTNGYQNLQQISNPLLGNLGLLMSNGLNTPVANALLNTIQLSRLPITNNVQLNPASVPICREGAAGVSITPNLQAVLLGNVGNLANIANIGTLANMANVGSLANIANVGTRNLVNLGMQFVPNTGTVNVPVRLRRNIQKNFGAPCNSAITYDSTLLGLY